MLHKKTTDVLLKPISCLNMTSASKQPAFLELGVVDFVSVMPLEASWINASESRDAKCLMRVEMSCLFHFSNLTCINHVQIYASNSYLINLLVRVSDKTCTIKWVFATNLFSPSFTVSLGFRTSSSLFYTDLRTLSLASRVACSLFLASLHVL